MESAVFQSPRPFCQVYGAEDAPQERPRPAPPFVVRHPAVGEWVPARAPGGAAGGRGRRSPERPKGMESS